MQPSHIVGGIKLGLSETSGSLLGTDSPWNRWHNKLLHCPECPLRCVCDSGFHNTIFRSVIHFELIFVNSVRYQCIKVHLFSYEYLIVEAPFVEKVIFFPTE